MKNKSIFLIIFLVLAGCYKMKPESLNKTTDTYRDFNSYSQGDWVLLAQSLSKDWYYDPKTLLQNDGVVSFWSYWEPNTKQLNANVLSDGKDKSLNALSDDLVKTANKDIGVEFGPKAYGPYLQKIDCLTNTHLSQSLIDGSCDASDAPLEAQNSSRGSDFLDCWRNVKPKTAIAYIQTRVCGRKFPLETLKNYFLFQKKLPLIATNQPNSSETTNVSNPVKNTSFVDDFYEVINNEYILLDAKKNIREMRVASYFLDKNLTHRQDFLYRANCSDKFDSLLPVGKVDLVMKLVGDPTSLSGVAFNRICGNHGNYMSQVKNYTQ